jgi:hypothetical protein
MTTSARLQRCARRQRYARHLHRADGRNEEPQLIGRDATVTFGQVLAVLEAARDAGRDVGDSIWILQELITENPRSDWCQCGHVEEAHSRHRRKDCDLCKCGKFRPE